MIKPISDPGDAGYVPLCAALQWIMSDAGARSVMIDDQEAWQGAVNKLWPLISSGEIELNGLPRGGGLTVQVPAHRLTLVKLLPPLSDSLRDVLATAPSHVVCTLYLDQQHWSHHFNDRLYITGQRTPAWTHLQLLKAELLRRWPRPAPTTKAQKDCYGWLLPQMKASPRSKPKSKETLRAKQGHASNESPGVNSIGPGTRQSPIVERTPGHQLGDLRGNRIVAPNEFVAAISLTAPT